MKCTNCGFEHDFNYCPACGKAKATTINTDVLEKKPEQQSPNKKGISLLGCAVLALLIFLIIFCVDYYSDPYLTVTTGSRQYTVLRSWKHVSTDPIDIYKSDNGFLLVSYEETRVNSDYEDNNENAYYCAAVMGRKFQQGFAEYLYDDTVFGTMENTKINKYPALKFDVTMNGMTGVGYIISFTDVTYIFILAGDVWGMEKEIIASIT